MNIPHDRVEDGVRVPCDGRFVEITVLADRHRRFLCTKCLAIRQGTDVDPIYETEHDQSEVAFTAIRPTGLIQRLWKAALRWLW